MIWAAIAFLAAVSVQKYRERESQQSQPEIKAEYNLEEVTEQLLGKVRSTLETGEFVYSFDNYSDQTEWGNRYSKLIFDELKQIHPNLTKEQIFEFPDIINMINSIWDRVRVEASNGFSRASFEVFRGLQHDYLVIGYPDPNTLEVTYNMSEEVKKDIKRFEKFVEEACDHLRHIYPSKKVSSKKLEGAIRNYMSMNSLVFYGLEKEHNTIRQEIIIDTIYQIIRKDLEIKKPITGNTFSLPTSEYVYCANRATTRHTIPVSTPLRRIVTPYVMRHKG